MSSNLFDLNGKVALVTGSNTGLGQGMSIALAQAGAKVFGVSNTASIETKQLIGANFEFTTANLISIEPCDRIIAECVAKFGKIDILINNAGMIRRADAIEFSENDWDDVMNLNLKSVFFLSQAAAKQFIAQKTGGKIINIASMLSFQGGIRVPSYTASKSGIRGITLALANEWAKYSININAIAPGYMATDNTKALRDDQNRSNEILARIPAGRWGTPADLMGACIFLASSASDYVNGATIPVDGGWLGR